MHDRIDYISSGAMHGRINSDLDGAPGMGLGAGGWAEGAGPSRLAPSPVGAVEAENCGGTWLAQWNRHMSLNNASTT
jgi:hypothetical protein